MRVSLCLLTKDELAGCCHDVPLIDRSLFEEIYAVDGSSQDGTVAYLQSQGIAVHTQPRKSLNAAVIHAFDQCRADAVVLFHPKGSIHPDTLKQFRPFFDQGYQLVVASRVLKGARNEEDKQLLKPRKWFVLLVGSLTELLFRREGNTVRDVLHGYRGMTCAAFQQFTPLPGGATIDLEMVTEAYRHRLKRVEFPVYESGRLVGETHFKALPTGWALLKYLLVARLRG